MYTRVCGLRRPLNVPENKTSVEWLPVGIGMAPACCGISGFDMEHVRYIVGRQNNSSKNQLNIHPPGASCITYYWYIFVTFKTDKYNFCPSMMTRKSRSLIFMAVW